MLTPPIAAPYEPYPDPDRPGWWRMPIVSGKHAGLAAIVDAADLPLVNGKRWNWSPGKPATPKAGSVVLGMGRSPKPSLGRVILGIEDPRMLVAHANGDRLDCRRANLLVRTRSESARLRKPSDETVNRLRPYPDPDRSGVWRVPLKGYVAAREVLIDEADLPVVRGRNWNWSTRSDEGSRVAGVVVLATVGRQLPLHRMIVGVTDPRTRVSFVNGDALDCRRANLVVRTLAEVVQASRPSDTRGGTARTSRFKGVSHDAGRGKWIVQIVKDKTHLHVGRFDEEVAAAQAYDDAARVLFGAHAYVNFPDRVSSEDAMGRARRGMDGAADRKRAERLRRRGLERELRRAAAEAAEATECGGEGTEHGGETIPRETARQLFDVIPTVWERWERFGWLPPAAATAAAVGTTEADDGGAMIPLADVARLLRRCGIVALPYPDPRRAGVYRVPLSGETAEGREALIDADAAAVVRKRRWRFAASVTGRGGEVQTMIPSENIRLHYVVMGVTANADEFHIGHRNDDPLDCRRANLVVRTLTDTHANHRKQATWCGRPCTSRFKGVCWETRRERWFARIKKGGVTRRLGYFGDEIAAAQAYDEAASELFGEHARLNFPDGIDAFLAADAAAADSDGDARAAA
ncbi:MAG TPA: HNH endonuclease [Tepidisphaeraceae bacterium]|nr:HNH endonuclease [Tepidisphaeraceae bacterium]